jgi:hypothetical protein
MVDTVHVMELADSLMLPTAYKHYQPTEFLATESSVERKVCVRII